MKKISNKVKKIAAGIMIATGVVLIVSSQMAYEGYLSYAQKVIKDENKDRNLILDSNLSSIRFGEPDKNGIVNSAGTLKQNFTTDEVKKYLDKTYSGVLIKSFYPLVTYDLNAALTGGKWNEGIDHNTYQYNPLSTINGTIVKDFISSGYSFDEKYGDAVPIILSRGYLDTIEDKDSYKMSQKEQYDFVKFANDKYVGKTFDLIISQSSSDNSVPPFFDHDVYHKIGLKVIVVGLSSILPTEHYSTLENGLFVPDWAESKLSSISSMKSILRSSIFVEFNSKKDRDLALSKVSNEIVSKFLYVKLDGMSKESSLPYAKFRDSLLLAAIFFLMISFVLMLSIEGSMWSKLSIGLFALVAGIILSFGINFIFSSLLQNQIFYKVAVAGDYMNEISKPENVFFSFPWITLLATTVGVKLLTISAWAFGRRKKV